MTIAVKARDSKMVQLLLGAGVDVNATNNLNKWTPLHLAVMYGKNAIARILLAAGADVHALDAQGRTPLHIALTIMFHTRENLAANLTNRMNILTELFLWHKYQTYNHNSDQQAIMSEIKNTFDLGFSNPLFRNQAAPWIQWIMAEIPECQSKQEFFQKIFEYLLGLYPEEQQKLLIENVKYFFLVEHNSHFYPLKSNLSGSQRKKLIEFKNLLTSTYAVKLKKDLFNQLSEKTYYFNNQLEDLPHLKELTNTIMKYCQNSLTKSPFLKAILKKYQAK